MSNYETDPAGLGIGKRFGARDVGGTGGSYVHNNSEREAVFHLVAGEAMSAAQMTATLPAGYSVTDIVYEVTEAFDGTTPGFTVVIGGGTASTEDSLGTIIAATSYTAGSITNLTNVASKDLVITPDTATQGATVGKARIVAKYVAL